MSKKVIIISISFVAIISVVAVVFGLTGTESSASEEDNRPIESILQTANIPTNFNHDQHMDQFSCDVCHHSKNSDGTKGPYIEGEEQTCVTCHNPEDMSDDIVKGTEKLNTYRGAAHTLCVGCHYTMLREAKPSGPTKKGNGKCLACHPSQKQYCPVRKWL